MENQHNRHCCCTACQNFKKLNHQIQLGNKFELVRKEVPRNCNSEARAERALKRN